MVPLSHKIVNGSLAVLILILHITIITVVSSKPNLRKIRSHKYIINLCCGHIMIAGGILIGFITVTDLFTPVSYLHINLGLIALTLDRFLTIQFPFRYSNWRKENYVLALLWFATVIATVYVFLTKPSTEEKASTQSNENTMIMFVIVTAVVIFILTLSNALLFYTARKQLHSIQKMQIALKTTEAKATDSSTKKASSSASTRKQQIKEIRQFYICFGFVLTYVLAWSPPVITKFIQLAFNVKASHMTFAWMITFTNLNSLSDALIFIGLNKSLRSVCQSIFCRIKAKPNTHGFSNTSSTSHK